MAANNSFFDWAASLTRFVKRDTARAEEINDALDSISNGFTATEALTNAAIKLPAGEISVALGNAAARKGKMLSFHPTTGAAEAAISTVDVATLLEVSAVVIAMGKRYLGGKSIAPTLDNDGAVLQAGAVYYDTVLLKVMTWTGTLWTEGLSAVAGVSSVNDKTGVVVLEPSDIGAQDAIQLGTTDQFWRGDKAWAALPPPSVNRRAVSATGTLTAADRGKIIDVIGTNTQTLDAPENLGDGWFAYVKANAGDQILGAELLTKKSMSDFFTETGSNLVVNGTFDVDANWTKGTGWTIAGGKAVMTSVAAAQSLTATSPPLVINDWYKVSLDVTMSSGQILVALGNMGYFYINATGTYTFYTQCVNTADLFLQSVTTATGTIDNFTVARVESTPDAARNVIVNGTFAADTNWTKGAGWTITGGAAYGSAAAGALTASVAPLVIGEYYAVEFVATVTSGTVRCNGGGVALPLVSASGTYRQIFRATTTAFNFSGVTAFTGTIDSVICSKLFEQNVTIDGDGLCEMALTFDASKGSANTTYSFTLDAFVGTEDYASAATSITESIAVSPGIKTISLSSSTSGNSAVPYYIPASLSLKPVTNRGDVTLAATSGNVDGRASYAMYPGEVRLLQCDGTTVRSTVVNSFYKIFRASGNLVKPPGYTRFEGLLWGGGASGAYATVDNYIGGGGGMCMPFSVDALKFAASESVIIAAGGEARLVAGTNSGGNSTFSKFTAYGAINTQGGGLLNATGSPATASVIFLNSRGANSTVANAFMPYVYGGANGAAAVGGSTSTSTVQITQYGGGGGGYGTNNAIDGTGGLSLYGGNGGRGGRSTPGTRVRAFPGKAPAAGGGAMFEDSGTLLPSGAGARGQLNIWGII